MLFLNTWLLLGLLGISIPVIIHLLNRRHAKVVRWGAMSFLLDSLISRRRRVLLEEMLLLASRCLLLALVALALARPFISSSSQVPWVVVLPAALLAVALFGVSFALTRYPVWRRRVIAVLVLLVALIVGAVVAERKLNLKRFGAGGARDVALVIDGSSSMTMTIDGVSNFSRAVKEALSMIDAAPRGFSFSLIIGGSVPNVLAPAPTPDRKQLQDLLREAQPVQGTMQALDTLGVAATTLARGDNPGKQIVVIGDGQSIGWRTDQPELWTHIQDALSRFPAVPQVIWRRLSMPQTVRNVTLSGVTLSRQVVGTDREVRIDVTVANTGGEAVTAQEVRLTIGDKVLSDRSLDQLQPGVSATVSFRHRFEHVGSEVIRAKVEANDEMSGDDEAVHVVNVMDSLKVLVVDSATTTRFLDRPGAFVTLALMPDIERLTSGQSSKPEHDFLVEPELMSLFDLTERSKSGNIEASVVVLVDVAQLPSLLAVRLADFVEKGGGLLVVGGRRVRPEFYNKWSSGLGQVMPLLLGTMAEPGESKGPTLDLKSFSHPALKPLQSSDLGAAIFDLYWTLETEPSGDVQIGARFATGEPFLAEREIGRGKVLQVNAPLDGTAGNLVARQSFLPLVHEMVYYLARPVAASLNLPPSRGATLQLGVFGGSSAAGGLRGEYFNHINATQGGIERVDPTISRRLTWPTQLPSVESGLWVRWSGSISVPANGVYAFETIPTCDIQIMINGHKIRKDKNERAEVDLNRGRRYDLAVEFRSPPNAASRSIHLNFSGPGLTSQPIPSEWLSPHPVGGQKHQAAGIETRISGPSKRTLIGRYFASGDGTMALRIDQNLVPGLYSANVPDSLRETAKSMLSPEGKFVFGVTVDGEESRLAPLSLEETEFIAGYLNFLPAGSVADVLSAFVGKSFGREIWRSLALAAFVLLLLEVELTRWIAMQRRAGEEETVTFEDANLPSSEFREQLKKLGA
jgi:hypothetical protein